MVWRQLGQLGGTVPGRCVDRWGSVMLQASLGIIWGCFVTFGFWVGFESVCGQSWGQLGDSLGTIWGTVCLTSVPKLVPQVSPSLARVFGSSPVLKPSVLKPSVRWCDSKVIA